MSDAIRAEATRWFARLHAPDASKEDRAAHAKWLAEDIDHELAYASIEQQWHDLGGLESWARTEVRRLNVAARTRRRRYAVASIGGAVAAAAALAAGIVWWATSTAPPETTGFTRIVTEKAEQRHVTLDDGSRVHVNTASELEVRFTPEVREIVVNHGESAFDVDYHAARPFLVRAGKHSVVAVGTRFAVQRRDDGHWAITVIEGRVAVVPSTSSLARPSSAAMLIDSAASSDAIFLEGDERLLIHPSGRVLAEEQTDAEQATAWRTGMLKFRRTPLRDVVRELSRYTVDDVRVADGVPDYPVTGIIQIRDTATMLGYLVEVVPVTPVNGGAGVIVLHESS